jgi:hypothetical protein
MIVIRGTIKSRGAHLHLEISLCPEYFQETIKKKTGINAYQIYSIRPRMIHIPRISIKI